MNANKTSHVLIFVLLFGVLASVKGQQNSTNSTLNTNTTSPVSTPSPSQAPTTLSSLSNELYPKNVLTLPWGEPSFGRINSFYSYYSSGVEYFLDTRRNGWSWTPSYLSKSAPFCYDTGPRPSWAQTKVNTGVPSSVCYDIATMCKSLGGTVYNDNLCIEDPAKPFTVVGPVCWNETCYNDKTFKICQALGGQFIGGKNDSTFNTTNYYEILNLNGSSIFAENAYYNNQLVSDAAWCAVPGKHTLVGPTCFGLDCFKEELSAACTTSLKGTNFADLFCLVDDSYTVIGPICTPTQGNATANSSICYPEETATQCQKMGGTNIGDIFCIVKGDYSVLGPFCTISFGITDPQEYASLSTSCIDASDTCKSLGGTPLGNGTFCVLNGEYTFVRPEDESYSLDQTDISAETTSWCKEQGGSKVVPKSTGNYSNYDGHGCILPGKYSIVGPMSWGQTQEVRFRGTEFGEKFDRSKIIFQKNSDYVILKGGYSVYGPSCYGIDCKTGSSDCLSAQGGSFGSVFCTVSDESTGTTVTSNTTSGGVCNNVNSVPITFILCVMLSFRLFWGNI